MEQPEASASRADETDLIKRAEMEQFTGIEVVRREVCCCARRDRRRWLLVPLLAAQIVGAAGVVAAASSRRCSRTTVRTTDTPAPMSQMGGARGRLPADYGDGDVDFYIANDAPTNKLFARRWRGVHPGRVARQATRGLRTVRWADYDNDEIQTCFSRSPTAEAS
jgi:hypothetical protein